MTLPERLAYLAGIIDGEGTITVVSGVNPKTGTASISCRVIIGNSDERLISWLTECFGGLVHTPGKTRKSNHKTVFMWYMSAQASVQLCEKVLPYLLLKRRQAEILIELWYLRGTAQPGLVGRRVSPATLERRAALVAELRSLNKRGR